MSQAQPPAGDDVFDLNHARTMLRFAFGAARRHGVLFLATVALVIALAVLAAIFLPRTYHTETSLLAQRNVLMPTLSNPKRAVPLESQSDPVRQAEEIVLKKDNLVSIIKQANLIDEWDSTRPALLHLKDQLVAMAGEPLTEEKRIDALVGLLRKKLAVRAGEGTVAIAIDWHDPVTAFRIVAAAQQNFLEARHVAEVSSISEAIAILESHAASVRQSIESTLTTVEDASPPSSGAAAAAPRRSAPKQQKPPLDREGMELKSLLSAKRKAIQDLEEFRQRRMLELQSQLTEQQAHFSSAHPTVVNTQRALDAMAKESPQLQLLHTEEARLISELESHERTHPSAQESDDPKAAAQAPIHVAVVEDPPRARPVDEESATYKKARLKIALGAYEELIERIESARIELDTARAAFKYRYSVIMPPEVPSSPIKPKVPALLIGGFVLAFLAALGLCVAVDISSGRVIERWQIERGTGLRVLAEIQDP